MSLRLLIGLVVLCVVRDAAAQRAIIVDAAGAPFAAADLVAALRVRVAPVGPPLHVHVGPTERGVHVDAAAGGRDVDLGGLRGAAAARLVALAASDLVDEPAVDVPVIPAAPAATLAVFGGVAGWNGGLGDVTVDLAIPRGAWVLALDVGGGELFGGPIQLANAIVRAEIGRRIGWFELRAGAVAAPIFVGTDAGDRTVLVGGSASVRAHLPLGPVDAVLAAGGDAFATQTEYRVAGLPVMTTPRVAPWFAVGVEVPL